ncbi:hypothetical protein [Metabacillus herbersteinensis]
MTHRDLPLSDQTGIEVQGGNPRFQDARGEVREHHSSKEAYA